MREILVSKKRTAMVPSMKMLSELHTKKLLDFNSKSNHLMVIRKVQRVLPSLTLMKEAG